MAPQTNTNARQRRPPAQQQQEVVATTATTTSSNDTSSADARPVLTSAPPPWHAVVLMTVMSALFLYSLPGQQKLDEIAIMETFAVRLFPDLISLRQLALIRAGIASMIWGITIYNLVAPGWIQMTPYLPDSKLKMVPNMLTGVKTLYPFTSWYVLCVVQSYQRKSWCPYPASRSLESPNRFVQSLESRTCSDSFHRLTLRLSTAFDIICHRTPTHRSWMILGVSFTLSSYIAFCDAAGVVVSKALLRTAIIVWEIAAPCTLLVAATVRYAMWPAVLRRGGPHSLNSVRNILMHNMNVVAALTESCLLSGLPVRWSEVAVAPLWGCLYVFFSWNMTFQWNERQHGPQFIYYFFDTTLPGYTCSKALVILLTVLLIFYAVFCTTNILLSYVDGGFLTHVLFVAVTSSLFMRFRD
jgi:hypothetical protein